MVMVRSNPLLISVPAQTIGERKPIYVLATWCPCDLHCKATSESTEESYGSWNNIFCEQFNSVPKFSTSGKHEETQCTAVYCLEIIFGLNLHLLLMSCL